MLRPLHVDHGIGVTAVLTGVTANIGFFRDRRGGSFTRSEVERAAAMVEHIVRALRLQVVLAERDDQVSALLQVVDHLPLAVVLVDDDARVVRCSRAAEVLLHAGDGLALARGVLRASSPSATAELHALIKDAGGVWIDGRPPPADVLRLSRRSLRQPLLLLVVPLPPAASPFLARRAAAAILISDPEEKRTSPLELVRQLYGLTPTEAAVALVLLRGGSLRQAADNLGVALTTARTHLQRVFSKTGARRQADLVRLLLSAPMGLR